MRVKSSLTFAPLSIEVQMKDQNMQNTENSKKVIVIGDGVVGKTSLVAKITEGKFINNYHMTLGVEYGVKTYRRGNTEIRLCLWDIAGQDPFRELMPQYARRSASAIVMCDVMRRNTMYEGAKEWKKSVDKSVYLPNGQPIPCVLLVNKCDCQKGQKQITTEEAFAFARDQGFVKCFETSVKDGTNINEALEYIIGVIVAYEEDGQVVSPDYEEGIQLQSYRQGKRQSGNGGCCNGGNEPSSPGVR